MTDDKRIVLWARWYEHLAALGGIEILGSFAEARAFFDLAVSPADALSAMRAGLDAADLDLEVAEALEDPGYSLAEDRKRQREAEAMAARTELIVRAAEANRPDLAPDPVCRRPSLSARAYIGSSWSG